MVAFGKLAMCVTAQHFPAPRPETGALPSCKIIKVLLELGKVENPVSLSWMVPDPGDGGDARL